MSLDIYAGKQALTTIREQGFHADLFNTFLGASGGPKWFVLYELDKLLFGRFFKDRTKPLNIVGSSVGAFRAACFAQTNPVTAIERMANAYINTTYGGRYVPRKTVTESGRTMIDAMLGNSGVQAILENPVFKAHFIAARAKGLGASENRLLQGMGLIKSLHNNRKDRSLLAHQYDRVIFQPADSQLRISDPYGFKTEHSTLTAQNTQDALLASGSLPMMMQGISNIHNAAPGNYRDGGIVDYHFDFNIQNPGLILYPHFSALLKPGWFDKNLPRRVRTEHYDRVVLLCPSTDFINTLPNRKIPDRSDFTKLPNDQRMKYWRAVCTESQQLADRLAELCSLQNLKTIRPIETLTELR